MVYFELENRIGGNMFGYLSKKNSCIGKKCRNGVQKSSGTWFWRVAVQFKH